ncbi:AAA family ATPase [Rossellomorea aquimaris]|uniref:AAA family ATPase n=1 Tax=Rossellomorea aquimaris TaxID=189382 RepID=UPI001CD50AE7|nr:AAA family ATPase [Rossellomorea aquimaris]MCA1054924.1 AAA family ATPase [Rossellomorea aquimaris]
MYKPKIIIADTDEKYITSLQLKFVEEYFDKVNLEIVTDEGYFEDLFSKPQNVDILVVSEGLYSTALQRHNIKHTFIMTEQYEKEQTSDIAIVRIFKYTSLKVIFNEIVGNSSRVLQTSDEQKDCKIILVYSASGGVGKTTLSLGMSHGLTKSYKRVLYINAGRLQYFQRVLKNQSAITSSEVYLKLATADDHIYPEIEHVIMREDFHYLPPFKASLMSLGLPYSIYETIAQSAKASKEYDYIIIDADPTFDEYKANLIGIADKVVIVTKQNRSSVHATNILVDNIDGVDSEKYTFVCNDFDREKENALISPDIRFTVNDYISHFEYYDQMRCEEFSKDSGVQRLSFLVV